MAFYKIGSFYLLADRLPISYNVFKAEDIPLEESGNRITLSYCKEPHPMENAVKIAEYRLMNVWRDASGGTENHCGWILEDSKGRGTLSVSPDYRNGSFYCETDDSDEVLQPLLQMMLECRMIACGMAVLHSACVEAGGRAVAFSGPSGTGKSTRALKWVENLSAEWISGDRPVIDPVKQLACGVPWDGKEQIFKNVVFPLHCILEVRRAPITMLRRLSSKQAYRFLANQIMIPMWDSELAVRAFWGLKQLAERIPVYRLHCDQTAEAARETYHMLFDERNDKQENRTDEECADMKLKSGFEVVEIAGDYMAIPTGDNMASYGGSVVLNEVSAFLLKNMKQAIAKEELLELLLDAYEVEREVAEGDLDNILKTFMELGLIEE